MSKPLTARTVSAYLASKGHTRTRGIHEGFRVTGWEEDRVTVEWVLGYDRVDWPMQARRDEAKMQLSHLQSTLDKRFDVALVTADDGIGWGAFLQVQDDPIKALPDSQQRAYKQIAAGGENYRYRPITGSLSVPRPLSAAEMTPRFSGGLHASTVLALERRGLVKLVPVTAETGRVVAL